MTSDSSCQTKITYTETERYAEDRQMLLNVLMELETLGLLVSTFENDYELNVTHRVWKPNCSGVEP